MADRNAWELEWYTKENWPERVFVDVTLNGDYVDTMSFPVENHPTFDDALRLLKKCYDANLKQDTFEHSGDAVPAS